MSISSGVEFMEGGGASKINMFSIKVEMYVHFMAQHCGKYVLFEKKVNYKLSGIEFISFFAIPNKIDF